MSTLAVALVNQVAFGNRVVRLGFGLVVTMAATAAAPHEILDVVQLVLHAVAFLYVPDKGIATRMGIVAAVIRAL